MSPMRWHAMGSLAAFLAMVPAVPAQQVAAHVGYVYPAGGRQGATLEVTIGGQFLDGVANAFVSGAGVEAKVIEHVKPLTQNQFNKLRDQLKELTDKRSAALRSSRGRGGQGQPQAAPKPAWTAEDEKLLAEIRKKMATFVRRPANPAIAEIVTLQVTMAPDAQPGQRELRLETPLGLTNPLVFCVGQLPEFSKKAAKVSDELAGGKGARYRDTPKPSTPEAPVEITLPTILNGQIMPGGVDRYRFQARKGERLVVAASARELIPYLPDAVPGWFQAALALYDAQGNELAYAGDYRFHPDPVLYYEIPSDGQYVIEIRDSIYRGREDFVYRIALGELPFVTSVFPLGGKAGEPTTVELKGWNLPVDKLTLGAEAKGPGIQPLSVRKGDLISNCEPFAVDTLPACLEQEPNDQPESAQRVTLPVIVNGRIGQPGDRDVFRFEGRAGEEIAAEVSARRLNSPLDSVLKLTDAAGRQLAFNDDCEDKGSGLLTHHADSYLRATLPADGTYYLHLGDAQQKGGAEHAYRLRISPPRPDFELRVVPSSISVRGGSSALLTVYALRKDGFSGEIALALQDAPEGFVLSGGLVPAGQDQVRLTLSVPPTSLKEPLNLHLEGRAIVEGKEVSRPAVPAEDMMQAFAYRHLVPAQELKVAVSGRGIARSAVRILSPTPVKIPAGGTARVQVGVPTSTFFGNLQLELDEPPEGITIQQVSSGRTGSEIVLQSDAAKVKPGLKGNLIVRVFTARSQSPGKAKAAASKRAPVGTLPAIPFEIVGL